MLTTFFVSSSSPK